MFYGIIGIYLAILLYIGYKAYHNETVRDFFVANRKLSMWSAGISLGASWIDASFIFLAITLGYFVHWNILWFCIGITLELLVYWIFIKRLKRMVENTDSFSYLDLIYKKLGKNVGLISTLGVFLSYILWNALQYHIGADILHSIFGLSTVLSLFIIAGFTLIYLTLGGFKASIKTDLFQFSLIVLFVLALLFYMPELGENTSNTIAFLDDGETRKHIFGTIVFILACGLSADGIIRMMATKNEKHASGSVGVAISIFLIIFGFFGYIGYIIFTNNPNILDADLSKVFIDNFVDPQIYLIAAIALLSALMSSIDTYTFTAGQALTTDGLTHLNFLKGYSKRKVLRISFLIVTILSVFLSLSVSNIMDFFFIALGFLGCGVPVFIALITGLSKNKNAIAFTVGLALLSHVGMFMLGNLNEETSVIINIATTTLWFGLELIERKTKDKK